MVYDLTNIPDATTCLHLITTEPLLGLGAWLWRLYVTLQLGIICQTVTYSYSVYASGTEFSNL